MLVLATRMKSVRLNEEFIFSKYIYEKSVVSFTKTNYGSTGKVALDKIQSNQIKNGLIILVGGGL